MFKIIFYLCGCCVCLCVCHDMWRSEDNSSELVLSSNHVSSGSGTRVVRLGDLGNLHSLSHLSDRDTSFCEETGAGMS